LHRVRIAAFKVGENRGAAMLSRPVAPGPAHRFTPGRAPRLAVAFQLVVLGAAVSLFAVIDSIPANAAAQCGFTALPPCPYIQDISPRLITDGEATTLTLRGGSLDSVDSVRLEPGERSLRFSVVNAETMTILFPGDVSPASYTVKIEGLGASQSTPTLAVVASGPQPTPERRAVAPVATPPAATATPTLVATPTSNPAQAAVATTTDAYGLPTTVVIAAAGMVALLVIAILGGRFWWRRRPEKIDKELASMWALDKRAAQRKPSSHV
jgi:hypothetical protein